jgi:hypothetical protein
MNSRPKNTSKTAPENKGLIQVQNQKSVVPEGVPERVDPRLCPRFEKCSIPLCPLDPDWDLRYHGKGDKVCRWLTEAVKRDGLKVLAKHLPVNAIKQIGRVWPRMQVMHVSIRRALEKASKTPSKMGLKARRAS